jgi:hypothetical protein
MEKLITEKECQDALLLIQNYIKQIHYRVWNNQKPLIDEPQPNIEISSRLATHIITYFKSKGIEYNFPYNRRPKTNELLLDIMDVLLIDVEVISLRRNFGKQCLKELTDLQKLALSLKK